MQKVIRVNAELGQAANSRRSRLVWIAGAVAVLLALAACVQLYPSSRGSAAFGPAMCPTGRIQLAGGACASCPDGMVMSVWPDRSGINCDYRQARPTRPPINSPLLADAQ